MERVLGIALCAAVALAGHFAASQLARLVPILTPECRRTLETVPIPESCPHNQIRKLSPGDGTWLHCGKFWTVLVEVGSSGWFCHILGMSACPPIASQIPTTKNLAVGPLSVCSSISSVIGIHP
jgi:hypothetical protein